MKKEDILEKSRLLHQDEGVENIENQGRKIGFIIFVLLFAFLIIFNLFFGETSTFHALASLFLVFMVAEAYVKYRFLKSKVYLITTIAGSIASILCVVNYILTTLR